jgi:predicted outer membrane protein
MRLLRLMMALVVIALLAFGCGEKSEKMAAEKMAEKAIESNFGGDAKVDIEKESIRIETDKGEMTMTAGDSAKLPANFPKDVFLYKDADLKMAMELPQALNLTFETNEAVSKVSETYLAEMTDNGWQKKMDMDMQGQKMMAFSKDERTVSVMISSDQSKTQIALTVATEK